MKKILILGGGGFIGGHLAKHFKEHGHFVRVVDIKTHAYFKESEICDDFILSDLRNPRNLKRIFHTDYDEVYQLASDVGGAGYIFIGSNDADIMTNSALININVARQSGRIGKLFFSSSSCAYPKPDGMYGLEKMFSEQVYQAFQRNMLLNLRIGRFQNVFGTHDTISGLRERFMIAVCRKIAKAKDGDSIAVWGGTQERSFIYVQDCIREIISLMNSDIKIPYNIGSERFISINDITRSIIDISGKKLNIENIPGPVGSMTKDYPGFTKEISFQGLRETYKWVKTVLNEN